MKKALLALAVAAAMPAVASAQTNITLTGSIDQSLAWVRAKDAAGNTASDLKVMDGNFAGSRVAIIGSEDIGGGLKGIFNIEHRLSPDTGAQTSPRFWNGQAWVGLEGGFGGIRLGHQYAPMYRALAPADLTGYTLANNFIGLAGTSIRWDNEVEYRTPNLGGFQGYLGWAAGENAGTSNGDAYGLALTGNFGPVGVGFGFARSKLAAAPAAGTLGPVAVGGTYGPNVMSPIGAVAAGTSQTEIGGGISGKVGPVGIGLLAAQTKAGDFKRQGFGGVLNGKFGADNVYLTLKREQLKNAGTKVSTDDGIGLSYVHGLSKRTFPYATIGYNKIKDNATGTSNKGTLVALGIRHFF